MWQASKRDWPEIGARNIITMTNLYKLIVTVLMTSPVIFGYRRFLDSRRQMKDRKFRNGEIREFRNLDPVYDFFLNQAFSKKPVSYFLLLSTVEIQ